MKITDEIVDIALDAYLAESGSFECGVEEFILMDKDAMRAALEAVAPMLVPDAYRAGFIEACRWPEPVSQDVDSGAFASAFRDWLAATPPNTTRPND